MDEARVQAELGQDAALQERLFTARAVFHAGRDWFSWCQSQAGEGLILTPNHRLARAHQAAFGELAALQAGGSAVWQPLACEALSSFQAALWRRLQWQVPADDWPELALTRLDALAAQSLWLPILAEDGCEALLAEVVAAHESLCLWDLSLTQSAWHSDALSAFLRWRDRYLAELTQRQAQDEAQQQAALTRWLTQSAQTQHSRRPLPAKWLPDWVVCQGFDSLSPPLLAFFSGLKAAGVELFWHQLAAQAPDVRRYAFADAKAELRAAVAFARQEAEAGRRTALVVPDLSVRLDEVEAALAEAFDPESIERPEHDKVSFGRWNLSAPRRLDQMPLITLAINLLALDPSAQSLDAWRARLLSPYLGKPSEFMAWEAYLARLATRRYRLTAAGLLAQLTRDIDAREAAGFDGQEATAKAPVAWLAWRDRLTARLALTRPGRQIFSRWIPQFEAELAAWGWPGERSLNSLEFQQLAAWQTAVARLGDGGAELDRRGPLTASEALGYWRLALAQPFHRQTPDAALQVLGVLEAAGQRFDSLWWIGLDNRNWPPSPSPNPWLPVPFQHVHALPKASAALERERAALLTANLLAAAERVIVSHPLQSEGEPLVPSPLIEAIAPGKVVAPGEAIAPGNAASELPLEAFGTGSPDLPLIALEPLNESPSALVAEVDGEVPRAKGGAAVLAAQAKCPFQAFARFRLAAKRLEPLAPGISPLLRGQWAHAALEYLWRSWRTQARLSALSHDARAEAIAAAIDAAVEALPPSAPVPDGWVAIEKRLLHARLEGLVQCELARPAFEVVDLEAPFVAELGGLRLDLRLDRLDRLLTTDQQAIIDYKTGRFTVKNWHPPRIREPQLPLYAACQPNLGAVILGSLQRDNLGFVGLAATGEDFAQVKPVTLGQDKADARSEEHLYAESLPALQARWREHLTRTAEAFVAGVASRDPLKGACQTCEFSALCRVAEEALVDDDEAEDDAASEGLHDD